MTPEERRAYDRARYAANPGPKKARAAAYRKAHPEKAKAAVQRWWDANPDRVAEHKRRSSKRYAQRHPERVAAILALWKTENHEHVRAYANEYRKNNPEIIGACNRRRHARCKGAEGFGFTSEEQQDVIALGWGGRCCYCEKVLTAGYELDHIVPLAKEGSHEPENLAPCCKSCNSSKGAKLLTDWRGGIYAESVPAHAAAIAAILRGE